MRFAVLARHRIWINFFVVWTLSELYEVVASVAAECMVEWLRGTWANRCA
jgi:hypothetical protein